MESDFNVSFLSSTHPKLLFVEKVINSFMVRRAVARTIDVLSRSKLSFQ